MTEESDLPEMAVVQHPEDGRLVMVTRGVQGFSEPELSHEFMATFNDRFGVTPRQRSAMLFGSLFGFDTPGANPAARIHDQAE